MLPSLVLSGAHSEGWFSSNQVIFKNMFHVFLVKKTCSIYVKKCNFGFPVSSDSAEALVRRSGKIKYLLIAYHFFWASWFSVFSFFITLFSLVPCGRLSWLFVSFLAHINIVYCIISYRTCSFGQGSSLLWTHVLRPFYDRPIALTQDRKNLVDDVCECVHDWSVRKGRVGVSNLSNTYNESLLGAAYCLA